jgi:hypothetical protein
MVVWENIKIIKNKKFALFICDLCKKESYKYFYLLRRKVYQYCNDCYQKSPERKLTAKKSIENRRAGVTKTCRCGKNFYVALGESNIVKSCSAECRKRRVEFKCKTCGVVKILTQGRFKKNKYGYCNDCFRKSPEIKILRKKMAKDRRSYNGKNNPNFRGKVTKKCKCGTKFEVTKSRENTAKYCSYGCASVYRPHGVKHCKYKDINFRSSWEMKFAQFLDNKNIAWEYEHKVFETCFGKYVPDFWVPEWNSFVEIKGYFREDAKKKFDEFAKNNSIILADQKYLNDLGIKV